MNRSIRKYVLAVVLLTFGFMPHVRADLFRDDPDFFEEDDFRTVVEDLVDIQVADRTLLAIIKGETVLTIDLQLEERILRQGTEGSLGLVMTDKRLLAVSTFTSNWIDLPLRIDETAGERAPQVLMSDFIILVVTRNRLLGFDSQRNDWVKISIPLHDDPVKARIGQRVAVAVTPDKAWGLAFGSAFFDPIQFMVGEKVFSVETQPFSINIRTNKRLLVFKATATWSEIDADY